MLIYQAVVALEHIYNIRLTPSALVSKFIIKEKGPKNVLFNTWDALW